MIDKLEDAVKKEEARAKKAQEQINDKYQAKSKKDANEEFARRVEEGKAEYDAMEALVNSNKKEITRLQEEAGTLTDKSLISANKRSTKLLQADLNYAKERMASLKAEYDTMLEERGAREEEEKFQDQIDAKYDELNAIWPVVDNNYRLIDKMWKEYEQMDTDA